MSRNISLLPLLAIICGGCTINLSGGSGGNPGDRSVDVAGVPGLKMHGNVTRTDAAPPPPSANASAHAIMSADFGEAADGSLELVVISISNYEISRLYVVLNNNTYIIAADASDVSLTAEEICKRGLDPQGITCSMACLKACACVDCPDSTIENNAEGACATNCSVQVDGGGIGPGEQWQTEVEFADFVYNGNETLSGTLPAGCSADVCASAAAAQKRRTVKFSAPDWGAVFANLQVGSLVAEHICPTCSNNNTPETYTSPAFASATVSHSACGPNVNCN